MKLNFIKNNNGFTVLFSVIVSAIVLSIGISIANITLKQIVISSAGRESQIAFYAADSGAECAIYHDLMFPENKVFRESESVTGTESINCFGSDAVISTDVEKTNFDQNNATTTFRVTFSSPNNYCADVTVSKYDLDGDDFVDKTIIQSRGYNICDLDNPRTLERGLEIFY